MLNAREGCSPVCSQPLSLLRLLPSLLPRRTCRGRLPRETAKTVWFSLVRFGGSVQFSSVQLGPDTDAYVEVAKVMVYQDHEKALTVKQLWTKATTAVGAQPAYPSTSRCYMYHVVKQLYPTDTEQKLMCHLPPSSPSTNAFPKT